MAVIILGQMGNKVFNALFLAGFHKITKATVKRIPHKPVHTRDNDNNCQQQSQKQFYPYGFKHQAFPLRFALLSGQNVQTKWI
jgi:hypothetical protein